MIPLRFVSVELKASVFMILYAVIVDVTVICDTCLNCVEAVD